jgi:hypothetical protein
MPLYENAKDLIRANLEQFNPTTKVRVKAVAIGVLTDAQLAAIHAFQDTEGLRRVVAEVVFHGWHAYKSRVLQDGYQIEDVIDQIESAMACDSVVVITEYMTAIENPTPRADRYGNMVNDRVVLECSARYPRPELYSVIPKGDAIKPPNK